MSDEALNTLTAITPLDGRYREALRECSRYFSEYALIKTRVLVEIKFLKFFLKNIGWSGDFSKLDMLEESVEMFSIEDAEKVKQLEEKIGHDVVAVTSYFGQRLEEIGYAGLKPFIHFGLTSEDVNNIAYSLMIRDFLRQTYLPALVKLVERLVKLAGEHKATPYLARTHGQPAVITSFGSFVANYAYRLASLAVKLKQLKPQAKIGGAVGDLSALKTVYPEVDWTNNIKKFIEEFGLEHNPAVTQILPHERTSEIMQTVSIINSVISNFCRDIWMLGCQGLVVFGKAAEQVHSSTMPQKQNPLMFENAEGALDLSTALLNYMSTRLVSSRLHRDLSDSVIKRFYGAAFSLSLLGVKNTVRGLEELYVNLEAMKKEVEENPGALMEGIQLVLRKHGVENGYWLTVQAVEKGLEWLRQQIKQRGGDPAIVDQVQKHTYLKPAEEKTNYLIAETTLLLKELEC